MPDEITFMDIASLLNITADTTLEKLGRTLNTSIFDISNIAGTLKQKGLIEFTSFYPGPTSITVTDSGKALIAEADARSAEPLDLLDESILAQLAGGKRIPIELQNTLSVRPRDLALRLYKLSKQGFIIYDVKNAGVELLLTEKGFLKAKTGQALQAPQASQQEAAQAEKPEAQAAAKSAVQQGKKAKKKPKVLPLIILAAVVLALAFLYYKHRL